jgi:hypothetical protein
MLSPSILGIPNRRMRYYLTATHCGDAAAPVNDDYNTVYNTINGEDAPECSAIANYIEELLVSNSFTHSLTYSLTDSTGPKMKYSLF